MLWLPEIRVQPVTCSHVALVDLTAPPTAAKAAQEALEMRATYRRGGLLPDRRRAERIAAGDPLELTEIRQMSAWFDRHASQIDAAPPDSALAIAWGLRGGDVGRAWARARCREQDTELPRSRAMPWAVRQAREDRTVYWRSWLSSVQAPTERKIRAQWRRGTDGLLPDQARRYSRRVGAVLGESRSVKRQLTADELDAILADDLERTLLLAGFESDVIEDGVRLAFERTARFMRVDLTWAPTKSPTDIIIGDMIQNVQDATKDRVAAIVRAAVDQGVSTSEIQTALVRDSLFAPARALRIARTETAKVASEGTLAAYGDASADGVDFKVEWVTARDGEVRESHQIDGQTVDVGGDFVLDDGEAGAGPGLFESAANVVNCRCATRPIEIKRPT